ncbi:hypothetical protein Q7C36_002709 [Tachysurus vachellii]|uniref:Uncharacterized protein n=1 Tax=Tachysurus vachellii TaxID=175792 RepID=A0AA88NYC2_TACVA|nr:hypothetical protein Q7C36_002709 [Tachysurus vachellii]
MSSQNSDTYQGLLRQELLQTPGQPSHPQISTTNSATVVTVPMANPAPYSGVAEECKGFLLHRELNFRPTLQPTQHYEGMDTPETKGPYSDWQTTLHQ